MDRAERIGLGGAAAGHLALLAILSLGLFAAPRPPLVTDQGIEVSLADEVALRTAAPVASQEAPAAAETPEPQAAPPEPQPAPPVAAAPPAPSPKPAPAPAQRAAKPAPAKPAPPARVAVARPAPPARQPGRLGDAFRRSLVQLDGEGTATVPRAAVGPAQVASLASAIVRQVQPCADRIVSPGPGAETIRTKLNLRLNRDGTFAAAPSVVSQHTNADNARYAARVGELARAAFRQCAPFELPPALYEGWRNINLNYRLPG